MANKTRRITCTIKHETDDAALVYVPDLKEEVWIPFSQIEEIHRERDQDVLVITNWLAVKLGL
jgi:hypothetical protein